MSIQHDVIAYHLSQGESRAQVCALAEVYFSVQCADNGKEFILTRGYWANITYMVTISTKDAP